MPLISVLPISLSLAPKLLNYVYIFESSKDIICDMPTEVAMKSIQKGRLDNVLSTLILSNIIVRLRLNKICPADRASFKFLKNHP